jgi:hypothetical protein
LERATKRMGAEEREREREGEIETTKGFHYNALFYLSLSPSFRLKWQPT